MVNDQCIRRSTTNTYVDRSLLLSHIDYLVSLRTINAQRGPLTHIRRGLPYNTQLVYDRRDDHLHKRDRRQVKRLKFFQILWPLKILTVLFHEVSHFELGMQMLIGRCAMLSLELSRKLFNALS